MEIYNTLSGKKEELSPIGDTIRIYVCGVTVYDECHIGHAMSYIIFDMIRRYLAFKEYKVKYIQNFTDIDDKIINRANQTGASAQELANKYIAEYFKDMDALNIKRADVYPRATEEIPEMTEIIKGLISKGNAYVSKGSVYFKVRNFPEYGKLSHQNIDEMTSKSTAEADEKDSPLDFALWKAVKPGEPAWSSPWGDGRPGWHIECSAMALKYLGDSIDIHGGGQDLIFPHHENEIAQSESCREVPFAKIWIHNGLLQLSGDKMSKSLGNLVTVKETLKKFSPDAVRFFILSTHYRNPLTYSEEIIKAAETGIERLRTAVIKDSNAEPGQTTVESAAYKQRFIESMDDDFNSAQALAALFDLAKEINRGRSQHLDIREAQDTLLTLARVLGFTLKEPTKTSVEAASLINLLISIRNDLRQEKRWQLADKIRVKLADMGIILEDTSKETIWRQGS